MSKSVKNLSLNQIKKQNTKKFKDIKRVTFDNAKLDIDLVFRPSKRQLVIKELMGVILEAVQNKKEIHPDIITTFGFMLIIKHFTSLETNAEGYDGLLEMMNVLIDGNYTEKILEAFDKVELETMMNELNKAVFNVATEMKTIQEEGKLEGILKANSEGVIH